jgi:hypothetical protein
MGGNGALRLAMKHPDVFGAVYGMNSCCMIWMDDFSFTNPAWHRTLAIRSESDYRAAPFLARAFFVLGSASSPDLGRPPYYGDLPAIQRR